MKHESKGEKGAINQHTKLALGEKVTGMKHGGKAEKKACGGMMKKGGMAKKKK